MKPEEKSTSPMKRSKLKYPELHQDKDNFDGLLADHKEKLILNQVSNPRELSSDAMSNCSSSYDPHSASIMLNSTISDLSDFSNNDDFDKLHPPRDKKSSKQVLTVMSTTSSHMPLIPQLTFRSKT